MLGVAVGRTGGRRGHKLSELFVLWLLLSACGGASTRSSGEPTGARGSTQGGRRLQAVFIESDDGVGMFRDFYDTELALRCSFVESDSGAWRCLPSGPEAERIHEIVYTDEVCTRPHAALYERDGSAACTSPRHAVFAPGCGQAPSVFELGEQTPSEIRYRLVDGVCSPSEAGTDYLTTLFAMAPVSLEVFQAAELVLGDETGGVVPVDLSSEDGVRQRLGFRDAAEGFDCALRGPDEDSRCVPTELGYVGLRFADASCSRPAAVALACPDRALAFAAMLSPEADVFYRVGAELSVSYAGDAQSCQEAAGAAFEVGTNVPIARFAAGRRQALIGAEVSTAIETVGAATLPPRTLRSNARDGHECHAARGTDGELRCLPEAQRFPQNIFADAECTQPVESVQETYLAQEVAGACPPEVRVYARGELHPGAVYALSDGVCAFAFDRPPQDGPRSPHYAFPSEITPREFARLSEVLR